HVRLSSLPRLGIASGDGQVRRPVDQRDRLLVYGGLVAQAPPLAAANDGSAAGIALRTSRDGQQDARRADDSTDVVAAAAAASRYPVTLSFNPISVDNRRHWAVVGGGMLGLTLAHRLAQRGQRVALLEAAPQLGGVASAWSLGEVVWDRHYHVTLL